MTKLTVDLENLKPLIDQAKETQRNIEQIYSGSRGYLRIANTQFGQDATQLETAYKRSIDQLGGIVSVLQTTYNAIRELQSDEGSRSTGTGNPWSRWLTGQSGYGDPVIPYVSSTRQVVEGVWNWFRVPPPVSQMMEQMKNNAVLASGTKSIQELADTNAFGIRLRGQFEAYNQELFGWMQDLGRAYSKGGQNEVAKRVEQIKEIAMQAYESLAPYTEYVRYFNESSSQEDEYAQTKNEDPGGHHVLGALQSFASGAWNAGASAISNGIYHDTTNKGDSNLAYTAGEIAGGLAAAGIGVIETIEGITVASAGIIASPETAGVAAVIIAPSLAVAALGVTTIGNGVSKIADGVHNFSSEGTGEVGKYDTKIKWGINDINARPYGKGFFGERIPQSNPRVDGYELKINPNNESYYLPHPNGGYVQFENLAGNVLQDGKLIIKPKSFYHVDDLPQFAKDKVLQEALRQQESALAAGYKVEWLVSDAEAVKQLTNLFKTKNIDIIVKYFPE